LSVFEVNLLEKQEVVTATFLIQLVRVIQSSTPDMGSLLGPQPKLGAKSKGMQTVDKQKKNRGPNWFFSPKLDLTGISPQVLDLPC
jgi:hypothetical protein